MRYLSILFFAVLSMCVTASISAEEDSASLQSETVLSLEPAQKIMPLDIRNKTRGAHIALILPLNSIPFWQDAEATKQGFFAATQYDAALNHDDPAIGGHDDLPIRVYESEEEGNDLAGLYAQAVANGAVAVVAGLTYRGYQALARDIEITVPTLTLHVWKNIYRDVDVYKYGNSSIITKVADNFEKSNLYFFGLSPEDEARLVARQAIKMGHRAVIIVENGRSSSKALANAYYREYVRVNAKVLKRIVYTGDPSIFYQLTVPRGSTIFLATNGEEAKKIRPLLPKSVPIYATSQVFDHRSDNTVLAGVRFADMPWIISAGNPMAFGYSAPSMPLTPYRERLYALGIDAYNLVRIIIDSGSAVEGVSEFAAVEGVSGKIQLDNTTFNRSALSVKFSDDGRVVYNNPSRPVHVRLKWIPHRRRGIAQKPFEFSPDAAILAEPVTQGYNPVSTIRDSRDFPTELRNYRPNAPIQ